MDNSTVSEDGDPVAEAHHLAEFVRDEDQAVPAVRHPTKDYEEIIDLPGGQDRSWLVKDQQFYIPIEGLDDLNPLTLTNGQSPYLDRWIDSQAVLSGDLGNAF